MLQRTSTRAAAAIAALLLVSTIPAMVTASHQNNNNVEITSPANGATFTRLDEVSFVAHANTRTGCTGSTSWDLGDGATASGLTAAHTYATLGAFLVTVTHTTTGTCSGAGVKTANVTIHVANIDPVAALDAPASVVAGADLVLDASGSFDADGGIVSYAFQIGDETVSTSGPLATIVAPTAAGEYTASVTVVDGDNASVTSDLVAFTVVADALANITIGGANSLSAGATGTFPVSGFDQYGNAVPLAVPDVTHTASKAVGTEVVSYTENGITGSKTIQILPVVLGVTLDMPSSYGAVDAALGAISGSVAVSFPGEGAMQDASVTVIIVRNVQLVGNVHNETISGTTDADGSFTFAPSSAFSVPGTYNVIVRVNALGNTGSTNGRYVVGA